MPYRQNKRTGEWWEVDANGNPIRPVQAQQAPQGRVLTVPQSPEKARQERRQAQIDAINQANDAERIRLDQERAAREEAKFKADLAEKGMMQTPDGQIVPIPGWKPRKTAAEQADQDARINALNSLVQQINRVQELGNSGPLASDGMISAIGDYLPTSSNKRFDTAGTQLSQQGLAAFRVPGSGTVSDRDAIMFDRGNLPQASNFDSANQEILDGLRRRTEEEYRSRGLPLPKWVLPNGRQVANVWDQAQIMAPVEAAAPFGATERQVPIPAEMQAEYQQYMANNFGNINPDDYANFRAGLDAKYGFGPQSPDLYKADAAKFNEYYNAGGRQVAPLPGPTEKLSLSQYISNSLENNPVTASLANAGDAASLGTISLIDRKFGDGNMQRLAEANPNAALMGQVAGSIVGGGALNRLGSAAAGRFLPALLQGGKGAAAARGIAGDVAYSTIYGTNTGGDPIESALMGGIGGALGRGVGGVAGKAVSGMNVTPALERLRAAGVTPTIGQIMRGKENPGMIARAIAGMEDVTANNGVTGNLINPARARALEQANNSAFNIHAGETGPVSGYGVDALNQLDSMKNAAYNRATEGVSIPLDDPKLIQQMGDARSFGLAQDAARSRRDFEISTREGLAPIFGNGDSMSGSQLQDALRFTQGEQRVWGKAANGPMPDPSARGVADAFGRVEDSLISAAARNAPGAIPKLKQANRINRTLSVLDSAVPTDGEGIFTGAQLMNAIKANNSKFGAGRGVRAAQKSPLFQLASDMQAVLPNKIPPTGVNAAPMLALMGLGSTGAGYATDNPTLGTIGAALLAATPYTRRGGSAVAKALLDRPDSLRALGTAINKRKGLFGAAAIPLMLEANN